MLNVPTTISFYKREWFIKLNKTLPFEATRMDLENIILSEVSQRKTSVI